LIYQIVPSNAGPDAAANVVLTDRLPYDHGMIRCDTWQFTVALRHPPQALREMLAPEATRLHLTGHEPTITLAALAAAHIPDIVLNTDLPSPTDSSQSAAHALDQHIPPPESPSGWAR